LRYENQEPGTRNQETGGQSKKYPYTIHTLSIPYPCLYYGYRRVEYQITKSIDHFIILAVMFLFCF